MHTRLMHLSHRDVISHLNKLQPRDHMLLDEAPGPCHSLSCSNYIKLSRLFTFFSKGVICLVFKWCVASDLSTDIYMQPHPAC